MATASPTRPPASSATAAARRRAATSNCTTRVCGDSYVNVVAGEECDDGNVTPGDGCNATCLCGPGSGEAGCQDALCPNRGRLVLYAGTTGVACVNNGDCDVGTCDTGLGVCMTATELDTGWTGLAHDSDTNDQVVTIGRLVCPGPFDNMSAEPCGECEVVGLSADTGDCRCASDNRVQCDVPFGNDADDCGGGACNCYFGPPLPLSSANTPACVVNRFANDVSGTVNVDLGSGTIAANLASVVYLGINVLAPCPTCGGTCTAPVGSVGDPCSNDLDCDSSFDAGDGVCGNYDPVAGDGNRNGTCWGGEDDGALVRHRLLQRELPGAWRQRGGAQSRLLPVAGPQRVGHRPQDLAGRRPPA